MPSSAVRIVPLEPGDDVHGDASKAPRTARAATAGTQSPRSGEVLRVATKPAEMGSSVPTVDEWGRDAGLVRALSPLAHLRWDVSVSGQDVLPQGAALIVINTRRMALTPLSTALALSEALDRPVRFVGRPDVVPFGPFLRRVGGLLARPEEIRGALRGGDLVLVGADGTRNEWYAGKVDHELVAAAVRERVPVHVAATWSTMFGRGARIEVAAALHSGRPRANQRRGPLAELELAEQAQRRLQNMLDEMGGTSPGIPGLGWVGLDWFGHRCSRRSEP